MNSTLSCYLLQVDGRESIPKTVVHAERFLGCIQRNCEAFQELPADAIAQSPLRIYCTFLKSRLQLRDFHYLSQKGMI
jgi:hypothetical protein